jgi:hypothetical protein
MPEGDEMQLTSLDRLLWALALTGHCVLLAVLILRHRVRPFPIFTTLIAANIVRSIVLYFTLRFGSVGNYFYTYWTLAIGDVALQLAVAYELATHVFQPLGAWAPDVRRSFLAVIVVSVLIALGLTWLATPPTRTWQATIVIRGNFFASALMGEIFVGMVALSVTLGLPWRTHVARLAQGFGVFSIFGIFTDAAHNHFGYGRGADYYKLLSHLEIELYLIVVLYWIVTLAMKEPEPRRMPEELREELRALQRRVALMLTSLRTLGSAS